MGDGRLFVNATEWPLGVPAGPLDGRVSRGAGERENVRSRAVALRLECAAVGRRSTSAAVALSRGQATERQEEPARTGA